MSIYIMPVSEFNPEVLLSIPCNRQYKNRRKVEQKILYRDTVCAFDIETTRLPEIEQSIMYLWQFAFDTPNGDIYCLYGRYWDEYEHFIQNVTVEEMKLLTFVHNLSYEFQFLRSVHHFDKVMCLKPRKILRAEIEGMEFRCSYMQTHKSLDKFLKDMDVDNTKIEGYDYDKRRYPWTNLNSKELEYGCNDVIGLVQGIRKRMAMDSDTLYSFPLTSTGYVRRKAKNAMKKYNFKKLHSMMCGENLYKILREEFRGGDTHANRYYTGKIIENVGSWDRSSSYPDVMINCKFPMSPFSFFGDAMEQDLDRWSRYGKCYIAHFRFTNIRQKDIYYGCPYLSKDKGLDYQKGIWDNGRLLSASEYMCALTDVDFSIVSEEYVWDSVEITDAYFATYGYLPEPLRELTKSLFTDKTALKGVDGEEVNYMLSKELINALYGMCAQNPVKEDITFIESDTEPYIVEKDINIKEKLLKYNRKAFLLYAWACWVTSWARYKLKLMVNIVGDKFVYCDTDSCKFIIDEDYPKIKKNIDKLNNQLVSLSKSTQAFAIDRKGVVHYMGQFEDEGVSDYFITLGAKKYAYQKGDDLTITIAGVNKKLGAIELGKAGGLYALKIGFVFHDAGGTESVYNDKPYGYYSPDPENPEKRVYIGQNIVIRPSEYTVGLTEEYLRVINNDSLWNDFITWEENKKKYKKHLTN